MYKLLLLIPLLLVSCTQMETQEDPKKGIIEEVCKRSEGFYYICPSDKDSCWYISCFKK